MFKELFETRSNKEILSWLDKELSDILSESQKGTFKEILASELAKFKKINRFYTLDNKLAIDGVLHDKSKAIKTVPYPDLDIQVRKDILQVLNVRIRPKFKG